MGTMEQLEGFKLSSAERLQGLKSTLRKIVLLRVLVFLVFAIAIYASWWSGWISGALMLGGITVFLYMVKRHIRVREKYRVEDAYYSLCMEELAMASGGWRARPAGAAYINASHPYTSDLNIFGRHSLFQFLNRCQSPEAEALLAQWLAENLNDVASITRERDSISHYASDPDWSLRYLSFARTALQGQEDIKLPASLWIAPVTTPGGTALRIVFTRVAPAIMLLLTLAYALEWLAWNPYLVSLIMAGSIPAAYIKRHQPVFSTYSALSARVAAYDAMLAMLRSRDFGDSPFREKLSGASLEESKKALAELQSISGAIDSRSNVIVGIVLNILLFWDFQCVYRLDAWQKRYGHLMPQWLQLAREAEAYQSLALYRFGHPKAVDVGWSDAPGIFCESATHPLLGEEAVANPVGLEGEKQFAIITGANMAGKSTYLRTVGVLAVMAMRGLPVTAAHMRMAPMKLYTSMLTTDSLGDHASYFFSELKRLREIVDALESGEPHFIILDEILKGTNSVDKAEGSKLFMQKLLRLPAKGLIATHDLSLCRMEAEHPGRIENLSFEVEFNGGQLSFDYRLRKGVCQNMNASFLLKEMGLV